jgi:galactoside O-acetyltransferase
MLRAVARSYLEASKRRAMRRLRPRVEIDESTRLQRRFGVDFMVEPEARNYLRVGADCLLNARIVFESRDGSVRIGDRVYIGANTQIISRNGVTIGDDVTMAWGITIYDHNSHSMDWEQRRRVVAHFHRTYGRPECFETLDWTGVASAPITICDRAWIGFDAVILKGVTIGEGAVVGARSVVARDVEPYTVVAGNPATVVRRLPDARNPTDR